MGAIFALAVAVITVWSNAVGAVDTAEVYPPGASDLELYLGAEGLGGAEAEQAIWARGLAGIGVADRFSAYFTVSGQAEPHLADGSAGAGFGVFGTPLDSDHVDLDLLLDVGFGADAFRVTPAVEINFDLEPDLALWGVWLWLGEALSGRDDSIPDDPFTPMVNETATRNTFAPVTELAVGTYITIAEGHQILFQYDMALSHNPDESEGMLDVGGVAMGYNVLITESVEMINKIYCDIDNVYEPPSWGVSTGLIATLE